MKRLEPNDFQGFIGTVFSLRRIVEIPSLLASPGNSNPMRKEEIHAELILTSVKPYELNPLDKRASNTTGKYQSKPFSIFFTSNHEPYLQQGMYDVSHPAFSEKQQIFIVCLGPNEGEPGYIYEAVFG